METKEVAPSAGVLNAAFAEHTRQKILNIPVLSLGGMLEARGFRRLSVESDNEMFYYNPNKERGLVVIGVGERECPVTHTNELVAVCVKRLTVASYTNKDWDESAYCETVDEVLNG